MGKVYPIHDIPTQEKEEMKDKLKGLQSQFLYLKADFENYRKRAEKEREISKKIGKIIIIEKLLNFVDIFENALNMMENIKNGEKLIDGMKLLYKELIKMLEEENVKPMKVIGEKFDPHLHEVVETIIKEEVEEDTIIEEVVKGYTYNGEVIRPAKVKISKKSEK